VRTGRNGRAELALAAGTVRLYGESLLRLPTASAAPGAADAVELDSGSSLFDILRRGRDDFEVRTPEVVVSIKGTRFLVVAEDRSEVAVYHGVVGVRHEGEPAREMLVRAGFLAIGAHGAPFELVFSGAPDPWNDWLEGGLPPRAPESAASDAAAGVEAAKAAARSESRRGSLEHALKRHPELVERVAAVGKHEGATGGGNAEGQASPPAAPADDSDKGKKDELRERYIEALLDPDNSGPGYGGGGQGPPVQVAVDDDEVTLTLGGQSWTFDDDDLEDVVDGEETFPAPVTSAVVGAGSTVTGFAGQLLDLLGNSSGQGGGGED
jgi:hypothetical protein